VQSQVGLDTVYGSDRAGVVSVNGGRGAITFHREWRRMATTVRWIAGDQPSPDAIEEFRVLTIRLMLSTAATRRRRKRGDEVRQPMTFTAMLTSFPQQESERQRIFDSRSSTTAESFGPLWAGPSRGQAFFFVTYEGDRIRRGTSSDTVTVPTLLERAGKFSEEGTVNSRGF